jgi:acyl-CoA synthetase (AMP-forming)/AMP-acid ligase II
MTIAKSILHFGRARPDAPAMADDHETITYAELAEQVQRTAGHLVEAGLRRGDRIGLALKDNPGHVIALLGIAHMGGVAAPLDWRARPAENARFVERLQLAALLTEAGARPIGQCMEIPLDDRWDAAPTAHHDPDPLAGWQDPFVISASSGSTGLPKLTIMTHTQYHFAVSGMIELMDLSGRHRFLSTMPLYYSGGRNSCLAHLLRGDCVFFYPSLFSAEEFVDVANRQRITIGGLVPSMVRQLLALQSSQTLLPDLAKLFSTGAPLHAEEKRAAVRTLNPHFHERYGTAETLAISMLGPEDFIDRAMSVGQPHSLAEIEIVDDDRLRLPTGSVGHLRYRGPGLAQPLLGGTEASNFEDAWFYPGEIAHLDERGFIFLQGRTSDVIMRSGAKIYPAEVEAVLIEHPAVTDAAVFGHVHAGSEETVVAFVVSHPDLSVGELLAHCRTRLSAHKVPRTIRFIAALPRNTAGKVDKPVLARSMSDLIAP